MGITSSFTWLGHKTIDFVYGQVDDRLNLIGQRWMAAVRPITPVRSGALLAGLFYRVEGRTLVVGGTAPHTLFVDRGTRNQSGQFFIERALNEIGSTFGAGVELHFAVPFIASPVLSHQGRMIVPSGIQPRPLTQAQHRRVQGNQAAMGGHWKGNVKRAKLRVRRFG